MDWLATELNDARPYIFPALWRNNPGFNDPERIAAGIKEWNHCITMLESQLQRIALTLADVVLRLSVNRWKITPFDKPDAPAIEAWFEHLNQRLAFLHHGNNGVA